MHGHSTRKILCLFTLCTHQSVKVATKNGETAHIQIELKNIGITPLKTNMTLEKFPCSTGNTSSNGGFFSQPCLFSGDYSVNFGLFPSHPHLHLATILQLTYPAYSFRLEKCARPERCKGCEYLDCSVFGNKK